MKDGSEPDFEAKSSPTDGDEASAHGSSTSGNDEEVRTAIESGLAGGQDGQATGRKFGMFSGVIRPTVLTILGVMMYIREGWVVGNAGLVGAVAIILTAYIITGATALSVSSITTNIRLGAGGVFALATQSLGLEVGGSIGIPFYLAQSLSTAMYIYGFMEGWLVIFPGHHPLLVVVTVFALVFLLSYISTELAFKVQFLVMSGVLLALSSVFLSLYTMESLQQPQLIGNFAEADYWKLFAIFFPASTGIMVGASMSGNLKNPRRSIPVGTMVAWGVSLFVYIAMAVWYALVATPEELQANLTIAVDRAVWGPAVLIGILSSCFTAALSSFVASPRTLQALGRHKIVPYAAFFGNLRKSEPRNAIMFTGALVLFFLLVGDLNAIAQVVTIFFLMTYFTINFILLIEKKLNLISFRPLFRIPITIPLIGSLSCMTAIIIVSPFLGLIGILISIIIYILLDRRALENPYETLNSGLFISIAQWAATKIAIDSDTQNLRSWKPDILLPVERTTQLEGNFRLLLAIVWPQGSVQAIGLRNANNVRQLRGLKKIVQELQEEGIFASSAMIDSTDFLSSMRTSVAVMKSSFFKPNILFIPIADRSQEELSALVSIADDNKLGLMFLARHPDAGLGKSRTVNLWIRDQSPNWHLSFDLANIDLPFLLAMMLIQNWNIRLRVLCLVSREADIVKARQFLHDLMILARMPRSFIIQVETGEFHEFVGHAPRADLNIFGLTTPVDKAFMMKMVEMNESTCIFVKDSGLESVLV